MASRRPRSYPYGIAPVNGMDDLFLERSLRRSRAFGVSVSPTVLGAGQPFVQLRPAPASRGVAHRDGHRLLLAHQHHQPLAARDPGVEEVPRAQERRQMFLRPGHLEARLLFSRRRAPRQMALLGGTWRRGVARPTRSEYPETRRPERRPLSGASITCKPAHTVPISRVSPLITCARPASAAGHWRGGPRFLTFCQPSRLRRDTVRQRRSPGSSGRCRGPAEKRSSGTPHAGPTRENGRGGRT